MFKKARTMISVSAIVLFSACAGANDNSQADTEACKDKTVEIKNEKASTRPDASYYRSANPYREMARLQHQMDMLMNQAVDDDDYFFAIPKHSGQGGFGRGFENARFFSDKDKYTLQLAVPGIDRKYLSVYVEKDVLTISADTTKKTEKKDDKSASSAEYVYKFSQSVSIPDDVETAKISSSYKDGVLVVTMPRIQGKKQPAGTNIPIN